MNKAEIKRRYNKCTACGRYCKKPHHRCSICRHMGRRKVSASYRKRQSKWNALWGL